MGDQQAARDVTPIKPEKLFAFAGLSIDRLPLLNTALEQLRSSIADELGKITTAQVVAGLDEVSSGRTGPVLQDADLGGVAAFFEARGWDSLVAILIDRGLMLALVQSALGADRAADEEEVEAEPRPLTGIELSLARLFAEQIMGALARVFDPIVPPDFAFVKLERRREPTGLGPENTLAVIATYKVESLYRGGTLTLLLPQSALLPMRVKLARAPTTVLNSSDPEWAEKIETEIGRAEVELQAVLEERSMTLQEITAMKPGQVVRLQATPQSRCRVLCENKALFSCALGQSDGALTLRIEDVIEPTAAVPRGWTRGTDG